MRVTPAPGLSFRDPRTKRLYGPGDVIPDIPETDLTFSWLIAQGDLVIAADEKPAPAKASTLATKGDDA